MQQRVSNEGSLFSSLWRPVMRIGALIMMFALAGAATASAQVVVFSPHPDDEALFASGIIYQAKQSGKSVKVVVATNGDCEDSAIGQTREQETVAAMALLGVPSTDVIFLGYPDCGLREMYYYYTTAASQFTGASGFTKTYAYLGFGNTDYHKQIFGVSANYSGYSAIFDIQTVLRNYKPQDIYVTSAYDANFDHYALNFMVLEATLAQMQADATFQPTIHDALVHEPCELCDPSYHWPLPATAANTPFQMPASLPPTALSWAAAERVTVPAIMQVLTPATNLKARAITQYFSQGSGPGTWLQSFVRSDEVFWKNDLWANRAIQATATASSSLNTGNTVDHINDGAVVGTPVVPVNRGRKGEWISSNQVAGAWAQLTWTTSRAVTSIVLHDRTDTAENITGGSLTFSDGSNVTVGALPTNGNPLTVTFAQKNILWVRFTATSGVGSAVGLSEMEVYGPATAKLPWTAPSGNTQPAIVGGPTASPASITDIDTSALTVTGFDANGDALTYSWTATGGRIDGIGSSVTFVPPTVTAQTTYQVTVFVADGRGGLLSSTIPIVVTPSPGPHNIAPTATATASSFSESHGQTAAKAIDGIVSGYPTDSLREWASEGQLAGAWIQLTWPTGRTISRSILHDRINPTDHILAGTLRFSDGSTVPVGALPNDGAGLTTDFPARTVTWIRFEVTSATGGSAGLAEWEVFSSTSSPSNTAPQITAGPTATPSSISDIQTSNLSVTATDANGDALTYSWTTTGGSITGSGANVSFTPPHVTGPTTVRVDVLVLDGHGGSATGFVNVTVTPSSTSVNLALFSTATASTQNDGRGQGVVKAIDGVVDGYPTDSSREWATVGQLAGAWIQLNWAAPQMLARVVLHDRINTSDQILSGTLRFSDGSTVPVGALLDNGAAVTVNFAQRSVSWVRLEVTGARGDNTGLAEFEVYAPSGPANTPPNITAGPTATPTSITDVQTATLTVTATDADGDPLSYIWTTTGGTIVAGPTVTFSPPRITVPTTFRVTVAANDGRGGSDSDFVDILVTPSNTLLNLAPLATITASSENSGRSQDAIKAVDGVVSGYPTDPTTEWASVGQLAGAWIQLTWSTTRTVSQVVLHDRINTEDQILGGTLTFSDGSSVPVTVLPNDGATGLQLNFTARNVTWARLTITSARGSNTGLAEFKVY